MHSVIFKLVVMSLAFSAQGGANAQAQAQPSVGLPEVALSRVDLGDFKIDATEVSIGRFAEYAGRKGLVTAAEREGGGFEYVMGWQRRPGWTWRTARFVHNVVSRIACELCDRKPGSPNGRILLRSHPRASSFHR